MKKPRFCMIDQEVRAPRVDPPPLIEKRKYKACRRRAAHLIQGTAGGERVEAWACAMHAMMARAAGLRQTVQ